MTVSCTLEGTFMKMGTVGRANGAKYECLLFESEVARMFLELYKEYGTTMAGLKALIYEFNNDEFYAYARGRLPYETLRSDLVLRNQLLSLPQRKIVSECIRASCSMELEMMLVQ
ncbi:hypothetical protein V6N13_031455 [Hibiscus sabdariffa]